jgi:regulator of protease activity HflC (stomatin/prohibitin superfamily)
MPEHLISTIVYSVFGLLFLILLLSGVFTVKQGYINIVTRWGKYKRIYTPGLSFKMPLIDKIFDKISTQNHSIDLKFQAITSDQANVHFKTMLLYSVLDSSEENMKKVAFKFNSLTEFNLALSRTIEGSIRSYVATKKQAEILTLRTEIISAVKGHVDSVLVEWGWHLIDLQVNDITFDSEVMTSMSKVVASNNLKAAAENEGQALLITKTKAAEAEGNAIKIQALAEKEAAKLRGEGVASFREAVAKGITQSAESLKEQGLDVNVIMFSMWTESIKNFAEVGKGNTIFLDGSPEGMNRQMNQIMSLLTPKYNNGTKERELLHS